MKGLSRGASLRMAGGLLLTVTLLIASSGLALAAPDRQDEAIPLLLGEFAFTPLEAGATATYQFEAPVDTTYTLTPTDAEEALAFDLVISDADGAELYNDVLETVELDLAAGVYTAQFTAVDPGLLSFAVVGQFGDMSLDPAEPGILTNGSVFNTTNIEGDLYATLSIPELVSPIQVNLYVSGAEGDSYTVSAMGDDVTYESIDWPDAEILQFWTQGGDYDLQVTPGGQATDLTLVVFMGGALETLTPGEPFTGAFAEDGEDATYQFTVEEAGNAITVQLVAASDDADFELGVGRTAEADDWTSYAYGPEEEIRFLAPVAGTYYVKVIRASGAGDYDLLVQDEGPAPSLAFDETNWGTVSAGGSAIYRLDLAEPGNLLALLLIGPADADIDLAVQQYDENGEIGASDGSYASGSAEIVGVANAPSGMYAITVNSYAEVDASFALMPALVPPDRVVGQWAVEATASSQYGDDDWSAQQATGAPNTPDGGDYVTAWASAGADDGVETLELLYEHKVVPSAVEIYESYYPGAVVQIEAYDEESGDWIILWEGEGVVTDAPTIFSPELEAVDFATDSIRLTLDTSLVTGFNEIDAVQLLGRP